MSLIGHRCTPFEDRYAELLLWYTQFERNQVFTDYEKALHLIVAIHNNPQFPELITFWSDQRISTILLNALKQLYPKVVIQAEGAAVDALAAVGEDVAEGAALSVAETAAEAALATATETTATFLTEA